MAVWIIPKEVLIASIGKVMELSRTKENPRGKGVDSWWEEEASLCRKFCGEEYRSVETDWIRSAAITLRKSGSLKQFSTGGTKRALVDPQGMYAEYLASEHWKKFREYVMYFWGGKCALCANKASDVHHNNYDRKWQELLTDAVPLCRDCHKSFHGAMPDGNEAFNGDQDDTAEDGNGYGTEESLF